eukprot:COSAG01_NODE_50657_length_361_cov_1.370229_1_plen_21_part_10
MGHACMLAEDGRMLAEAPGGE